MGVVVTGIAQSTDTEAVEKALRAAGLSLEQLTILTNGDGPEGRADSGIRFIYTGADTVRNILGSGSGGITSFGAEMPGVEPGGTQEFFQDETLTDQLSELAIPDSELEGYVEALEAGRSVFAYYAQPATVATAEDCFRQSGVNKVRTY